jgi:hypothetical protein
LGCFEYYREVRGALPHSFLQEPAENVTPALFRKFIRHATDAPVMKKPHTERGRPEKMRDLAGNPRYLLKGLAFSV